VVGAGACSNKVVTATVVGAPPTCNTLTSAYVDGSIASTSALSNGNYAKAGGASALVDSGVMAGPYTTEWMTAYRAGSTMSFDVSGTKMKLWGATLEVPLNTSALAYNVTAADLTGNLYDIGIYDASGSLKAHTGAIAGSTATVMGAHSVAWSGGGKTLQPGKYYLAITTNCTTGCATLAADVSTAVVTFLSGGTVTTSGSQGTLDASITPPAGRQHAELDSALRSAKLGEENISHGGAAGKAAEKILKRREGGGSAEDPERGRISSTCSGEGSAARRRSGWRRKSYDRGSDGIPPSRKERGKGGAPGFV